MVDAVEELFAQGFHPESQVSDVLDKEIQRSIVVGRQDRLGGAQRPAQQTGGGTAQLPQGALDVHLGHVKAECIGGGVFQVVRFVNDQVVVFGQDTVAGGDICQQQGMVDHQNVRALRSLARLVEGADTTIRRTQIIC